MVVSPVVRALGAIVLGLACLTRSLPSLALADSPSTDAPSADTTSADQAPASAPTADPAFGAWPDTGEDGFGSPGGGLITGVGMVYLSYDPMASTSSSRCPQGRATSVTGSSGGTAPCITLAPARGYEGAARIYAGLRDGRWMFTWGMDYDGLPIWWTSGALSPRFDWFNPYAGVEAGAGFATDQSHDPDNFGMKGLAYVGGVVGGRVFLGGFLNLGVSYQRTIISTVGFWSGAITLSAAM
jgi:hypothetical protein